MKRKILLKIARFFLKGIFKEEYELYSLRIHKEQSLKNHSRNILKLQKITSEKNNAYYERNQLVSALSKVFNSWISLHPSAEEWDDDWRHIIFIKTPAGQCTWHIHDSELKYFDHLKIKKRNTWDGHNTKEKYERLREIQC